MLTWATRLELSARSLSPERMLTSVMLRPASLLRPGGFVLVFLFGGKGNGSHTLHCDNLVVVDVHGGKAAKVDVGFAVEMD